MIQGTTQTAGIFRSRIGKAPYTVHAIQDGHTLCGRIGDMILLETDEPEGVFFTCKRCAK